MAEEAVVAGGSGRGSGGRGGGGGLRPLPCPSCCRHHRRRHCSRRQCVVARPEAVEVLTGDALHRVQATALGAAAMADEGRLAKALVRAPRPPPAKKWSSVGSVTSCQSSRPRRRTQATLLHDGGVAVVAGRLGWRWEE